MTRGEPFGAATAAGAPSRTLPREGRALTLNLETDCPVEASGREVERQPHPRCNRERWLDHWALGREVWKCNCGATWTNW